MGTNPESWLGVPLKTSDRIIGVMAVQDYEHPNRYAEHDRDFLASIATQVALAIEHREAGIALHESEKRYRALFEDMPIAIWEEDFSEVKKHLDFLKQQGITDFRAYFASHPEVALQCGNMIKILDVNNAAVEMFQAGSKEELIRIANGEPGKGEQENNIDDLITIIEGGTSRSWEGSDETCLGNPIEIDLSWSVAPGYEQDYSRVIVTTNDITERKKTEESLKLFRTLIDRSSDAIEVVDPETFRFIDINEKACQDLGYSRAELLSLTVFDIDSSIEFSSSPQLIQTLQQSGFVIMETIHQRKDGSTFPVELNMKYTQLDKGYVVAISRDITERKKAEIALLESNIQFRTLFEASPESIMLIDPRDNWPILDCNTAACQMNGFTREELVGQSIDILNLEPGEPGERMDYMERIYQAEVLRYETSHRKKDGTTFPVEVSTCLIMLGGRQVVLGIDRDITERRQAEVALRESEALYRQAIEVAGAVPYYESYYGDGRLIKYEFIGEGIRQITGYGPEEFNAKIWDSLVEEVNLVEELDGYSLEEGIQRVRSGKNPIWKCEHRLHDREGNIHWVFEAAVEVRDEQGISRGSIGTYQDITERKRVELELRASEERFVQLANNIQEAFWITDAESGREIYMSPATETIWGIPVSRFLKEPETFINGILPEDRPRVLQTIEREKKGGKSEMEYRIARPDGSIRWIWDRAFPISDEFGVVKRIAGISADITERKQAEDKLRESEMRFAGIVNSALDAILSVNEEQQIVLFNAAAELMFGCTAVEAIGQPLGRFIPDRYRIAHQEHILNFGRTGISSRSMGKPGILKALRANGEEFPIEASISRIEAGGQHLYTVVLRDITERRQAEAQLRQLSRGVEQSTSSIIITDTAGNIEYVNPKFTETSGYSSSEVIGRNPHILKSGFTSREDYQQLWKTILSGEEWHGELLNRKKGGELYWEDVSISPILNEEGEITNFIAVKDDITQRKQNEIEARRHLAELEALYENGLAVGQLLRPREIGERVIHTFSHYLPWHHVTIRLKHEDSDDLELIAFAVPSMKEEEKTEVEQRYVSGIKKWARV